MKQKIARTIRRHKLAIVIALTVLVFWLGRLLRFEMTGKAAELMIEPILERCLESFTREEG